MMIRPIEDLYEILNDIIDKECGNRGFTEYLKEKFAEKKLSVATPNLMLSEELSLADVDDIELICFTEACKEYFSLEVILDDFFGADKIVDYKQYINAEVIPTQIVVKNVIRDEENENRFIAGFVPYYKFATWEKYRLTRYNYQTQRDPIYKKLSNGKVIVKRNINETSVSQMTKLMYDNKFESNMVTYNILISPDIKPNYSYNPDTLELTITPNYDHNSKDFTVVDIIDGQHRITSATRAVAMADKNGTRLKGSLHACFYLMTLDEAKSYIEVQARQNAINKEYKESLKTDAYTEFVDRLIQWKNPKQNILQNNVAKTYDEMEVFNKLTYKPLLTEAVRMTRVDVDDNIEKKFASEKMAEIINTLVSYMVKEFYNNDSKKMQEEGIFLSPNIFIGYIALAEQLRIGKDYIDKLVDLAILLQDKEVKEKLLTLKLKSKTLSQVKKNIFTYFRDLVINIEEKE